MKINSVSKQGRTRSLAACLVALPLLMCFAVATAAHAQTLTTLHNFTGTDGAYPNQQLVKGSHHRMVQHPNGFYYSVTPYGGANSAGTVYQVNSAGVHMVLYNFCSIGGAACTDGSYPEGALLVGNDNNLYGTTYSGGAHNAGTVFKITTSGALTTLYSFGSKAGNADGSGPFGALVQGNDGNLYGTTYSGGNSTNDGTVFKISCGGSLTTIHSFSGPDGANPEGDLLQGPWDGNFYGATLAGGNSTNSGTMFYITSGGTLTTVYSFCSLTNCIDGSAPQVPFTPDAFGNFYGTTAYSGANAGGTIFNYSPFFGFHTLYHFCAKTSCTDGAYPEAGPVIGSNGDIYGTTLYGGASNNGTAYEFTPWGVLYSLYNFCSLANCSDGQNPEASLIQGTDGNFYGTTAFGGANGYGTAFNLATLPSAGNDCNGVYSGQFWGNITVSNGETCEFTDGGQIFGNVYVKGGSLILTNASVLGNVQVVGGTYTLGPSLSIASNLTVSNIPSGSAQNTICGVQLNGDLQVNGNGTAVEIGQSSGACPGNTIGGNLQVNSNTGLVQIFNNSIRSNLQCSGNNPAPTGAGNTARNKQGQCSSF
jgi:uncharacterized repeat protein (TIGR03803 family)